MKTIEQILEDTKAIFEEQAREAMDKVMTQVYNDYLPHVENDMYYNVRNLAESWIERFMADKLTEDDLSINVDTYNFSARDIRQKIWDDQKDTILPQINRDLIERLKQLEEEYQHSWQRKYV